MGQGHVGNRVSSLNHGEPDPETPLGPADWLSLAATPAFAIMALLTAVQGGSAVAHDASMPGSMVVMYSLMCLFHSAAWIRVFSRQRLTGRHQLPRPIASDAGGSHI